jgi:HSP20 family protein
MNSSHSIHRGLQHTLEALLEGWHALRQRALHALTHFTPGEAQAEPDDPELRFVHGASRWGLLAAEVREEDDRVVVSVEIPGMEPEDFSLEVSDEALMIRGEKRASREQSSGRHFVLERAYGGFERRLHLPAEVDRTQVSAHYRRGVLSVVLPKLDRTRSRRVKIETA